MIDDISFIGINTEFCNEAEIIASEVGSNVFVDKYTRIEHCKIGNNVRLERNNQVVWSEIGKFSYTGANTVIKNAKIGSFCSVAWNVSIGGNTHDLDHITTHSFLVYPKWNMGGNGNWRSASEKCEIGNDVWIGSGANILRGVTVGNGAVIGASSVVTKNVPPYSIIAGNPGHILRMRFCDKWIEQLEELKWWNFPEGVIKDNFALFSAELSDGVLESMKNIKAELER